MKFLLNFADFEIVQDSSHPKQAGWDLLIVWNDLLYEDVCTPNIFQALFTLTVIVANDQRTVQVNVWIPNKWPLRTKVLSGSCQPHVKILFIRSVCF